MPDHPQGKAHLVRPESRPRLTERAEKLQRPRPVVRRSYKNAAADSAQCDLTVWSLSTGPLAKCRSLVAFKDRSRHWARLYLAFIVGRLMCSDASLWRPGLLQDVVRIAYQNCSVFGRASSPIEQHQGFPLEWKVHNAVVCAAIVPNLAAERNCQRTPARPSVCIGARLKYLSGGIAESDGKR